MSPEYKFAVGVALREVAAATGIGRTLILSDDRTDAVAWARHAAMALCREHTDLTLQEIGAIFSQTHSNVGQSVEAVKQTLANPDRLSRLRARQYFRISSLVQWRLELREAMAGVLSPREIKEFCRV